MNLLRRQITRLCSFITLFAILLLPLQTVTASQSTGSQVDINALSDWKFIPLARTGIGGVTFLTSTPVSLNDQGDVVAVLHIDGKNGLYRLTGNNIPVRLVQVGDVTPIGSITAIGGSDNPWESLYVTPQGDVIFFGERTNPANNQPQQGYFRWSSSSQAVTELVIPASTAHYDFRYTNSSGFWLASSNVSQSNDLTEERLWATDGKTDRPAIQVVTRQSAPAITRTPHGISADGNSILMKTVTGGSSSTSYKISWFGARTTILVERQENFSGELTTGIGISWLAPLSHSEGLLFAERNNDTNIERMLRIDANGAPVELANTQSAFFSFIRMPRYFLSQDGVPVFAAMTDDIIDRFFIGPDPIADELIVPYQEIYGQDGGTEDIISMNGAGDFVIQGHLLGDQSAVLLLATRASNIRWSNPAGGSWETAGNWMTNQVPGQGHVALFDLAASYDVVVGQRQVGNVKVEGGSVAFKNAQLWITGALSIGQDAFLSLPGGSIQTGDTVIGSRVPAAPENPPTAHFNLFNTGTVFTNTGTLRIGSAGQGEMFISNGAQAHTSQTLIGDGSQGSLIVGGEGSNWSAGAVQVGARAPGSLTVEEGAHFGVDVLSVGSDGSVLFNGPKINLSLETLGTILGSLSLGATPAASGRFAILSILNGADIDVGSNGGHLVVGDVEEATLILRGKNSATGQVSRLVVTTETQNPGEATCFIGGKKLGDLYVDDGAQLFCNEMRIGSDLGGGGYLGVNVSSTSPAPAKITVKHVIQVGSDTRAGVIEMNNSTITAQDGILVREKGRISGNGSLEVGLQGLVSEGSISPELLDNVSVQTTRPFAAPQPATLAVNGSLSLGSTSRISFDLNGPLANQQDHLRVSGTVALGGEILLNFANGYAPKQGETLSLIQAASLNGAVGTVTLSGLQPGFEFQINHTGSQLTLTALNDGIATTQAPEHHIFLPLNFTPGY